MKFLSALTLVAIAANANVNANVGCDGTGGAFVGCDASFMSRANGIFNNPDYNFKSTKGHITYYSHYLNGHHNWFALITNGKEDCWNVVASCHCSKQLDFALPIPGGYIGERLAHYPANNNDYVIDWVYPTGYDTPRDYQYNKIRLNCD